MCGIVGIYSFDKEQTIQRELLDKMNQHIELIKHFASIAGKTREELDGMSQKG